MKPHPFLPRALIGTVIGTLAATLFGALPAAAQPVVSPHSLPEPATTVYRQVTPDGRILYTDEPKQGAKVEQAISIDLPPVGSTWSVEGSKRPPAARVAEPTPVKQVATIPHAGGVRSQDEAAAELIRAEMLLEDARRKRDAAHAPLLDELGATGPGSPYAERQRRLAREVAQAEAALRQAKAELAAARRRH